MARRTKVRIVCAIGFLCAVSLSAQEVVRDTITGKVHQIEKVTVTARRLPNKVTSSVPIQTLSQQDISQLGIQNMADAVRRFAGANVKDYGGIGGLKTVSVRNMGAAHTAVSYDGVVVSNCQAGQIDIGRFSLDNVSVLSLNIGQPEDLLQSARMYASAGVLSIETEKPHFENERNSAFRVQMRGGSFGYVSPSIRWWQKAGSRTSFSLNGNYMRADGNYPFTLVNGKYVTEEKRNNSAIYTYQIEPIARKGKRHSSRRINAFICSQKENSREPHRSSRGQRAGSGSAGLVSGKIPAGEKLPFSNHAFFGWRRDRAGL